MSGKLLRRLQDPKRSGVYRASRADELVDALRGSELLVARIAFGGKKRLLENIAAALAFPPGFGHNWDALADSLSDLSWREAPGYVLVFEDPEPGDDLATLSDVLRSSAEFWAGGDKPFFAVFVDPRRALELPDLFRE